MAFETPIIDSGAGANENPLGGAWANLLTVLDPLKRASNVFAASTGSGLDGSYRPGTIYASDCEFYVRIASVPGTGEQNFLYARLQGAGGNGTGFNGYSLEFGKDGVGNFILDVDVLTNASGVQVPGTFYGAGTWSIGDYVGIRCIGSSVESWYKPVATGVWGRVGSGTDSTYSAGGPVGLALTVTSTADQLGGGSLGFTPNLAPVIAGRGAC